MNTKHLLSVFAVSLAVAACSKDAAQSHSPSDENRNSGPATIQPLPKGVDFKDLPDGVYAVETGRFNPSKCYITISNDNGGSSGRPQTQVAMDCPAL
ncbi:MAG: hypothetical protein LRZ85_08385 [Alphaproteobacteria bacterium]|nr:hypothetical protein [Alphaproteobacteria bacterium]MCD8525659.1 hypothetical protein [Alphaproteobacteria bacterium]